MTNDEYMALVVRQMLPTATDAQVEHLVAEAKAGAASDKKHIDAFMDQIEAETGVRPVCMR